MDGQAVKAGQAVKRLISISVVAVELGVSVNTVYAWVNQRRIPYVKVGRLLKFDRKDIEAWIEDRKIGVREERN